MIPPRVGAVVGSVLDSGVVSPVVGVPPLPPLKRNSARAITAIDPTAKKLAMAIFGSPPGLGFGFACSTGFDANFGWTPVLTGTCVSRPWAGSARPGLAVPHVRAPLTGMGPDRSLAPGRPMPAIAGFDLPAVKANRDTDRLEAIASASMKKLQFA